jgi:hypothetical protein
MIHIVKSGASNQNGGGAKQAITNGYSILFF